MTASSSLRVHRVKHTVAAEHVMMSWLRTAIGPSNLGIPPQDTSTNPSAAPGGGATFVQ
jgi:hypothetical protein